MTTNYFLQTTDNSTNATSTQFVKSDWDGTTTGVWTDTAVAQWEVAATINNMVYMLDSTKTSSRVMNLASSSVIEVTLPQAVDGLVNDVSDTGLIAFYSATPTVPTRLNSYLGEWSSYPVSSGTFSGFTSATGAMVLRSGTKLLSMSSSTLYSFETTTGVVTTTDVAAACGQTRLSPVFAVNDDNVFAVSVSTVTSAVTVYSLTHAGALASSAAITTYPASSVVETTSYAITNAIANSTNVDVFFSSTLFLNNTTTRALLHLDGANAATTTVDVYGNTVTMSSCSLSTTQPSFGSSAALFTSAAGAISVAGITQLGSAGWTIESKVYFTSLPASTDQFIFAAQNSAQVGMSMEMNISVGSVKKIGWYLSGNGLTDNLANGTLGAALTVTTNTYYHFAIVHDTTAASYYAYFNGVSTLALASAQTTCAVSTLIFGNRTDRGFGLRGAYVDECRFRNECIYPGGITFTPSTAAFVS